MYLSNEVVIRIEWVAKSPDLGSIENIIVRSHVVDKNDIKAQSMAL